MKRGPFARFRSTAEITAAAEQALSAEQVAAVRALQHGLTRFLTTDVQQLLDGYLEQTGLGEQAASIALRLLKDEPPSETERETLTAALERLQAGCVESHNRILATRSTLERSVAELERMVRAFN